METLYSAKRLGHETSLRWLIFNDDVYSGYVINDGGNKFPVDSDELSSHYSGDIEIRISSKVNRTVVRSPKETVPKEPPKTPVKSKPQPKREKHKPKSKEQRESVIIIEDTDNVSYSKMAAPTYHKDIFVITDGSGFSIEVDGSFDDAETLQRVLLSKYKNLTIHKRTIRTLRDKVDVYYIVEHKRKGETIFEMDFDLEDDAKHMKSKRLLQYPNDDIFIHHVEEILS